MSSSERLARLRTECRLSLVLALPIVVGQLLSIAMNVIDTLLAGRLETRVLAATSQGYQLWVVALLVLLGILLAVTPAVAQRDGAGRRAEVGHVFRQALWLALLLGGALFVALRCAEPLLRVAHVDEEIVPEAQRFLRAIAWGAPALGIFFVCRNTSEGLSLTRPTMYVSLLGVAVLLPLAWMLMYGRLGCAPLGAAGAGAAHAIVLWLEAAAYAGWLALSPRYRDARLFERFEWPQARTLLHLLRVGVPMGTSVFMEGSLFVAAALVIGSFGAAAAGAHAIAINVASLTFMVPLGIAMATTVRVGNAVGRGDAPGVAWAGAAGMALVLCSQCASASVMYFGADAIARLYSVDPSVTRLAATLLGFAALFQFSDGVQAFFNGALRGLEDTLIPALITCFAYWGVGFTLGWWLGVAHGQGAAGLWKGLVAGLTVAAVLLASRFAALTRRMLAAPVHGSGSVSTHVVDRSVAIGRDLTDSERELLRAALERGACIPLPDGLEARIAALHVVAQCRCGCGSVVFAHDVATSEPPSLVAEVHGENLRGESLGIIVWGRGGVLTALEIYDYGGRTGRLEPPLLERLRAARTS